MNGTRQFRLAEFIGGPRDGDTMTVDAGMETVCIPLPAQGSAVVRSAPDVSPCTPGRVGEYRRRRTPHRTAVIALTEMLIARARVPLDTMVRMGLRGTEPTPYDWAGEA